MTCWAGAGSDPLVGEQPLEIPGPRPVETDAPVRPHTRLTRLARIDACMCRSTGNLRPASCRRIAARLAHGVRLSKVINSMPDAPSSSPNSVRPMIQVMRVAGPCRLQRAHHRQRVTAVADGRKPDDAERFRLHPWCTCRYARFGCNSGCELGRELAPDGIHLAQAHRETGRERHPIRGHARPPCGARPVRGRAPGPGAPVRRRFRRPRRHPVHRAGARQWVLRHYYRGGPIGRLLDDQFLWLGEDRTRCFREWRLLARLTGSRAAGAAAGGRPLPAAGT